MIPQKLLDGIGFYLSPVCVQGEDVPTSDIGRMIMSNEGIIYSIPSLDQVSIILIPMSLPCMSNGSIPLDPDFTWEDPDTLDLRREWTPELLVRYFEDTVREGVRSEGRKVILGYGWVKSCLRVGRVLGSVDDWGGWRVIGSYDLFNTLSQPSNPSNTLSQTGIQPHSISLAELVQPYFINHANNLLTSDPLPSTHSMPHSFSAPPHHPFSHSVLGHGTIPKSSNGIPLSIHGGAICCPQRPPAIRLNTDHHAVPMPEARFRGCQPSDTGSLHNPGNHPPHHLYNNSLKRAQHFSRTPVSTAMSSNASAGPAQIRTPPHSRPQDSRFHPYLPSVLQNSNPQGQSQVKPPQDHTEHSWKRDRSRPGIPPQKMAITKTRSILPAQKLHLAYIPPSPISPAPPYRGGRYAGNGQRTSLPPSHPGRARDSRKSTKSPPNVVLQPTKMTSLSQPIWWDMSTSRTIGVSISTEEKETSKEDKVQPTRGCNRSGHDPRAINGSAMICLTKPILQSRPTLTPQSFKNKFTTMAETSIKPLFINSSGSPLNIFIESNVHPRYQKEVRLHGGHICPRAYATIAVLYRSDHDDDPFRPKSAAENGAIWQHGRTGGITVTLQWLKGCLEKGEMVDMEKYRVRVVDCVKGKSEEERAGDASGVLNTKDVVNPLTLASKPSEPEQATVPDKTLSLLSTTSFPTCPPISDYDPLAWQVEKMAQKIHEKGKVEALRTTNNGRSDQVIDDYWTRFCSSTTYGPLIKARVRQLHEHSTDAPQTVQENQNSNAEGSNGSIDATADPQENPTLTIATKSGSQKDENADLDSRELGVTSSLVDRLLNFLSDLDYGRVRQRDQPAHKSDNGREINNLSIELDAGREIRDLTEADLKTLDRFFAIPSTQDATNSRSETGTSDLQEEREVNQEDTGMSLFDLYCNDSGEMDLGVKGSNTVPVDQHHGDIPFIPRIKNNNPALEELERSTQATNAWGCEFESIFENLLEGSFPNNPILEKGSVLVTDRQVDVDSEESEEDIPLRVLQARRAFRSDR